MQWYLGCWNKFAEFSGRARRQEFWMFVLFNFLAAVVAQVVGAIIGTGILFGLYQLAVLVPSLAVAARRLHDTDRSGWWLLVGLVPLIGFVVLLIFFCCDSQPGENRFGPNPKGA